MAITVAKLPDIIIGDSFTQVLEVRADTRDWRGCVLSSELKRVTGLGPRKEYVTVKVFQPVLDFYAAPDYSKARVVLDATEVETAAWGLGQFSGSIVIEQDGYGRQTLGAYNFNGLALGNIAGAPRATPDINITLDTPDNIAFVYEGIGIKGDKGDQGDAGPQGAQGIQGVQGVQGPAGPAGPIGPKGDRGEQGVQGMPGVTGAAGATGQKGDVGPVGPQGIQGPKGDKGIQGDAGLAGAQGPKGDTGAQGPAGSQGPAGATGAQGLKGDTGDTGPQGAQGAQGPQGIQGIQGIQGPAGQNGADGVSAEAITGSVTFADEENYTESTVTDALIHADSNLIVGLVSSEDAAIQGINVGVVSYTEGSAVIYGGAPQGATGTFNVNIHIV